MENESNATYEAKLSAVANELHFEAVYTPEDWEERVVTCSDTLRPGLALTGFYDCFDNRRIQLIGRAEQEYLEMFTSDVRYDKCSMLCAQMVPAIVVCWGMPVFEELIVAAKKFGVPVLGVIPTIEMSAKKTNEGGEDNVSL